MDEFPEGAYWLLSTEDQDRADRIVALVKVGGMLHLKSILEGSTNAPTVMTAVVERLDEQLLGYWLAKLVLR